VSDQQGDHFLAHPEIRELFAAAFTTLVKESDRGAVLIGCAHVDRHLRALFERVAPPEVGRKKKKAMLSYPGPLATLSAKADVALATKLITPALYTAIDHLRRLRNDVAHSPDTFRLSDHDDRLQKVYELGPGVPIAINRFALEIITNSFSAEFFGADAPRDAEGKPFFASPMELFAYVKSKTPDVLGMLEEKRRRYELSMGVVLICALLVHHREQAARTDRTASASG
jgi:hypothetical protein